MPDIWRLAVLAVFVVTLLLGANAAYASPSSTTVETVSDEEMTVNYTVESSADAEYARNFLNNETITDSDGNTLSEGTDYDWNTSNGNVTWYDTAETTSGETVTIDYAYNRPTEGTRLTFGIMKIFGGLLGILLFVVSVSVMYDLGTGGGL